MHGRESCDEGAFRVSIGEKTAREGKVYTLRCALRQAKNNQEEARREAAVPQGPVTAHRSRYEVFREMDGCDAVRLPSSGPLPVHAKAHGGALHTEQDTPGRLYRIHFQHLCANVKRSAITRTWIHQDGLAGLVCFLSSLFLLMPL